MKETENGTCAPGTSGVHVIMSAVFLGAG